MRSRLHLLVVVLLIGAAGFLFIFTGQKKEAESAYVLEVENTEGGQSTEETVYVPTMASIFVHVCGKVKNEGVYELKPESRVEDAIKAAGGLTSDAAGYGINQAEKLKDGAQIYVPSKKEVKESGSRSLTPRNGENTAKAGTVNINTATKEELMTLNGVGEAKAELIISYRESNGGFKEITDIMKIKGIKQKFFDKIKDKIGV